MSRPKKRRCRKCGKKINTYRGYKQLLYKEHVRNCTGFDVRLRNLA